MQIKLILKIANLILSNNKYHDIRAGETPARWISFFEGFSRKDEIFSLYAEQVNKLQNKSKFITEPILQLDQYQHGNL